MVVLKFETIKAKNHLTPQNTHGYSVTYLPESNSLLLYGVLANSDIYTFSLTKQQWQLIRTSGKKPSFRRFYAHYYHRQLNGLIIHGGQVIQKQKKSKSSDQCYILFVENWQWRKIFLPESPHARQFHQFFCPRTKQNDDQLVVFGGFSKPYDTFLNDMWSFRNLSNLSTKTNKHQVHGCQSTLIHTKGQAPGIYGYATRVIGTKVMFIGGESVIQKKGLQVNLLCLKSLSWQRVELKNKICPPLICLSVYESGIDSDKLHIMGGIVPSTNKANQKCYSLSLEQMEILQQNKSRIPSKIIHSCLITETPLCIAGIQINLQTEDQQMQVHVMYQKQPSSAATKHFQTDQIEDSKQDISIEQYLKAIKHEQILSQELIKKNFILEELYKEIQRYIAALYAKYLIDDDIMEEVEKEKRKNIHACEELKHTYMQNALQFEDALKNIKKLRAELGLIHEDFQRCIETEIDQEET